MIRMIAYYLSLLDISVIIFTCQAQKSHAWMFSSPIFDKFFRRRLLSGCNYVLFLRYTMINMDRGVIIVEQVVKTTCKIS